MNKQSSLHRLFFHLRLKNLKNSEDENSQLQSISETNPYVIKLSINNLFLCSIFFQTLIQKKEKSLPFDSSLDTDFFLNIRKGLCSENCIQLERSKFTSSDKTSRNTARPFLLESLRKFLNLLFDEHIGRITNKNRFLKMFAKLFRYTDITRFSQEFHICLPLTLFHSVFMESHEYPYVVFDHGSFFQNLILKTSISAQKAIDFKS